MKINGLGFVFEFKKNCSNPHVSGIRAIMLDGEWQASLWKRISAMQWPVNWFLWCRICFSTIYFRCRTWKWYKKYATTSTQFDSKKLDLRSDLCMSISSRLGRESCLLRESRHARVWCVWLRSNRKAKNSGMPGMTGWQKSQQAVKRKTRTKKDTPKIKRYSRDRIAYTFLRCQTIEHKWSDT